ncbi:MAG: PAS domain S-box protein [bacterium]|nr:PAS domain S-box protein [bacterium]
MKKLIIDQKKLVPKGITESVVSILATLDKNKDLTKEEAQKRAIELTKDLRYGQKNKGYIWINDFQPEMVMHPIKPETLMNRDLGDFHNPDNVYIYKETIKECNKPEGGGYVEYLWKWKDDDWKDHERNGDNKIYFQKISYVKAYKPWDWIIGTGVYIDDIDEEVSEIQLRMIIFLVIVSLMSFILLFFISRALSKPITKLIDHIEKANDIVYSYNQEGRILYMNPGGIELLGYTKEEITNINYLNIVPPEYRETELEFFNLERDLLVNELYREIPLIGKDGSIIWFGNNVHVSEEKTGSLVIYCIARDITIMKTLEKNMRNSETKYRSIIEKSDKGYYELDLNRNITYCNDAVCNITGYTARELKGSNFQQYVSAETAREIEEKYRSNTSGNVFDCEIIRKDNEKRYAEVSYQVKFDKNGNFAGACSILMDITERKNVETILRQSEEKYRTILEKMNEGYCETDLQGNITFFNSAFVTQFMTKESSQEIRKIFSNILPLKNREMLFEYDLTQRNGTMRHIEASMDQVRNEHGALTGYRILNRDITKKKKAEDARQELKNRFFANISHEIRTPLTLILTPVESVLQGNSHKEIKKDFFEGLRKNGLILMDLINNILDFSRIEAGRMGMKLQKINILSIIKKYIDYVIQTAKIKNISIVISHEHETVENLFFDLDKIERVLMNLFSNSLKFTRKGGEIKIRVSDDESYCYINFEDTGIGIPEDKINTVFDRFSTADTSSTRKNEGTGIGLSLVKELIEMHGGSISVTSRSIKEYPDDHGSKFTITLLKGEKHFQSMNNIEFVSGMEINKFTPDLNFLKTITPGEYIPVEQEPAAFQHTILIVEDNPDMSNFLTELLKNDYGIHTASNGKEGLNKAHEVFPDLIITDVMMPVMDGYEMIQKIKDDININSIPVLIITARADISHKIEGLEYGAHDYLSKPFNPQELNARIQSLLRSSENEKMLAKKNRRIASELQIAKQLQQKLLPEKMAATSGYKAHPTFIPMNEVGGDFYDYGEKDNKIELFIADVEGKGLPGAFLSMIAKISLENITDRQSASRVLYLLNDAVCRSTVNSKHITSFFCSIDTQTNKMKYCSAGHEAQFLFRKSSNEIIALKTKGPPLGWFNTITLEEKEVQLLAGDRILFYTDGITECLNAEKNMYEEKRLKDFIKMNASLSPEEFSEKLMAELKKFSGSHTFDDDLTFIVFDVL